MIGKKRILVVGANGYIGLRLCHFLHSQGYEIIGSFSTKPKNYDKYINFISKFIIGDIRRKKTIQMIAGCKAHIIIYLVSLNHFDSEKNIENTFNINVRPISNILSILSTSKSRIEKFLFFSTVQVYGNNLNGKIKEQQQLNPNNIYALTHQLGEEICNYYHNNKNIKCINIRLSNSYGQPLFENKNCWDSVINNITKSAYESKKIVLKSDGNIFKDFIHFSEICSFINFMIKSNSFKQNTYNLTSSNTLSLIDAANEVKKAYFKKYNIEIPIYINTNHKYSQDRKKIFSPKFKFINDDLINESIKFSKPLVERVEEIFNYLENNSKD